MTARTNVSRRLVAGALLAPALLLAGLAAPEPGSPGGGATARAVAREGEDTAARACLEGRAALHVAWIDRHTDTSTAALEALVEVLDELVDEASDIVERRGRGAGSVADVEMAWSELLASERWTAAWEAALDERAREELGRRIGLLDRRLEDAALEVLVVTIAAELRLRRPQADALREGVRGWLADPRWQRDRETSADPVLSVLGSDASFREVLSKGQIQHVTRMHRPPFKNAAGATGESAWPLSTGRYPEDDFGLEALALVEAYGWDEAEASLLLRGARAMGREYRRTHWKPRTTGQKSLVRTIVDLDEQPLWQALRRREEARLGVERPAGPAWCSGDREVLVRVRRDVVLAHLDRLLLLDEGQREALAAALLREVGREYDRGVLGFGAVGGARLWRAMQFPTRLGPGKLVQPRLELLKDLREILTAPQLRALGIEEVR